MSATRIRRIGSEDNFIEIEVPVQDDLQEQIDLIRWVTDGDVPAPQTPPEAPPVEEGAGEPELGEDGIPNAWRSLMIDGESPEKFTERMRRRWSDLQQYRIDGTKPTNARALPDMSDEEKAELDDLTERNRRFRWLD